MRLTLVMDNSCGTCINQTLARANHDQRHNYKPRSIISLVRRLTSVYTQRHATDDADEAPYNSAGRTTLPSIVAVHVSYSRL